ncbi:MAG: hypothetical protein EOM20_10125, partial [Spartobacteria bacterium]|nr:hypothetical protein [Spartobacteria bacterium]
AWYMSSAPWGGRLYVHAGSYDGSTTNAYWFDGTSWTPAPAPDGGQFSCIDVAVHDGDMYIAGGYSGSAGPPMYFDSVYTFHGTNWQHAGTLPTAVSLMGLASHEGALTLFGGSTMGTTFDTVYSLKYGRWIEQAALQLPYPREQLATLTCRGRTHLVGGNYYENGVWAHTNVLVFDGRAWVEMTGMPEARYGFGSAVWSDEIYIAGGADSSGNESSQCWKSQHGINGVGGVSPARGGHVGSTLVTIYGENLGYGDVSRVTLCGAEAQIIADYSPTQLVVCTASNEVGLGDVVIESPTFGTTVKTNGFEYVQASIVTLSSSPGGTILGAGEIVVPYGESTCVDLVPADYWLLDEVLVDGASIGYTNAVVLFDVTNAVDVHTVMNAIMASNGVPHWWLAESGLTNDFDAATLLDTDNDGSCNWQEYVAGTQYTNSASVLRIFTEKCGVDNELNVITWQGTMAEDRFYTLYYASNIWSEFSPIVSNLPSPQNSYTDIVLRCEGLQLYRVKVENREGQ